MKTGAVSEIFSSEEIWRQNIFCWKFNNIVKAEIVYLKTGGVTEIVSSEEI